MFSHLATEAANSELWLVISLKCNAWPDHSYSQSIRCFQQPANNSIIISETDCYVSGFDQSRQVPNRPTETYSILQCLKPHLSSLCSTGLEPKPTACWHLPWRFVLLLLWSGHLQRAFSIYPQALALKVVTEPLFCHTAWNRLWQ